MNKGREFITRTLSGALFVAVFVSSALFMEAAFVCFTAFVCLGSLREFYRLAGRAGAEPQAGSGALLGTLILLAGVLPLAGAGWMGYTSALAVVLLSTASVFIAELYRKRVNPIVNIATTLAGWLYTVLPLFLIVMMAHGSGEYRPWIVLWFAFMIWANDIGAYITGITMGKHRLMERISPRKSWEGFFGGLAAAVGVGFLAAAVRNGNVWGWVLTGVAVCISGVFGDLVESMFKRSVGVKDSGSIMPGHGGFLDRFDAMFMAAPFAYIMIMVFNL